MVRRAIISTSGALLMGLACLVASPAAPASATASEVMAVRYCPYRVDAPGNYAINVRSGPGEHYSWVGYLYEGQIVGAQDVVQNGYRKLGEGRWAWSAYLIRTGGSCWV